MQSRNELPQRIVFFDGVCHLCNGFVDTVIAHDRRHRLAFAPLQGSTAQSLLSEKDRKNLDSVVYYENGRIYRESTAVLKILSTLSGAFVLSKVFFMIPEFLRNFTYRFIAQRRSRWFGERTFCRRPQPHEQEYLLP